MELIGITYQGPAIDDRRLLDELPDDLRQVLSAVNGFIQFQGGLHVRGVCSEPRWHSLHQAWRDDAALHSRYDAVDPDWIPFAQDCVGDQFLLRDGEVLRLYAETGEIEAFESGLIRFLDSVNTDPAEYLGLEPLLLLHKQGGVLEPGQLIHVYPPFCTKEAADGVSVRAVPADELLSFHADFAAQLPPDGETASIRLVD